MKRKKKDKIKEQEQLELNQIIEERKKLNDAIDHSKIKIGSILHFVFAGIKDKGEVTRIDEQSEVYTYLCKTARINYPIKKTQVLGIIKE